MYWIIQYSKNNKLRRYNHDDAIVCILSLQYLSHVRVRVFDDSIWVNMIADASASQGRGSSSDVSVSLVYRRRELEVQGAYGTAAIRGNKTIPNGVQKTTTTCKDSCNSTCEKTQTITLLYTH